MHVVYNKHSDAKCNFRDSPTHLFSFVKINGCANSLFTIPPFLWPVFYLYSVSSWSFWDLYVILYELWVSGCGAELDRALIWCGYVLIITAVIVTETKKSSSFQVHVFTLWFCLIINPNLQIRHWNWLNPKMMYHRLLYSLGWTYCGLPDKRLLLWSD